MPDYVIETYDEIIREEVTDENGSTRVKFTGTKYEKLDGQNIRVFMPSDFDEMTPADSNLRNALTMTERVILT